MPRKTAAPLPDAATDTVTDASPVTDPSGATTFQEAYQQLQDAVQTVRTASAEDLDTLVACVKQGAAAHAVCKARIQAVQTLLADYGVGAPSGE